MEIRKQLLLGGFPAGLAFVQAVDEALGREHLRDWNEVWERIQDLLHVETVFAIDSTGVVGNRFVRWTDVKYRGMIEHVWAKVHLMGGVKTHIITAAVILDRNASDVAQLPNLLHTTAQNFTVRQVSADAVYNTKRNQEEIATIGAEAFIPFKSNHTGKQGGLWGEKFRQWQEDREYFLKNYHQRSTSLSG